MDLLKGRIRPLYFKYLSAAFGSALISSIYGIVDMAMVGQYQGPQGTAAMAVISPIWNIIYSLGLLMGIGGSVLLSTLRGESEKNLDRSNEYFTAAIIGVSILALITSGRCSSPGRRSSSPSGAARSSAASSSACCRPWRVRTPSGLPCRSRRPSRRSTWAG